MKKLSAIIQIVLVLLLIGFGTFHLYKGNFELSMATIPVLVGYYLFMLSRQKKAGSAGHGEHGSQER